MHLLSVERRFGHASNIEITFLGWYFGASDAVSHSTFGSVGGGATACPRLRCLRPRSEHGVPPGDQAAPGAGLGSGLLPHQVLFHIELTLWSKKRRVFMCVDLPGVEENGAFLGTDKLVWTGRKRAWRTSENVSVIFSQ